MGEELAGQGVGRARKVVLAYSGGVDTSVCIPYLREEWGVEEVITFAADLGQGDELEPIRLKALEAGASQSLVGDLIEPFITEFAFPAIRANALYEGRYPLSTALARPLIARELVAVARLVGADAVAHGCTGKGNDQVRFDVAIACLAPELKVLTPAREWGMSREETIAYGERFGMPAPVSKANPYSIDLNLLGRSVEAGPLEDPQVEPPEEVFAMTRSIAAAPEEPEVVEIGFVQGNPVSLNGEMLDPVSLVRRANDLAGSHGFGRLDIIENRVVGIKSREIYETPGLLLLIRAHQELESLTLAADVQRYKRQIESSWADLVYQGLWFGPLKAALDGFLDATQATVNGTVRIRLHKGNATVIGRSSALDSLYVPTMATYGGDDRFDHRASEGFIYIWGLPARLWAASLRR
ncbi:argininosuccinate synthase [Synechococcus sp. CS-602]|uniref:argininosuccinate synthase n=1 Tax=Synechococcaceae TaxID=1890426 RepID=UPI0008FF04C7|nr:MULTISPECIES: argininosuccinate synthase [Synechococcaceae]MCT4363790.1 argininosuccinate synthase [Candidatus Regnicoccus frigidus MAG-AL1]APD47980.1 argininosuccinate synthase [Synechococcus sp. SynAce01]MCT0201071.1 argininosuccinate synthase [Synechococcus sp. CS-603]MCT0204492.1 argininosuccinate synthase [Synechococcus sp. CS-602]MCT0245395.1 argininosuccinate synthase [Synechococcus sp. CS-601]